VTDPTTKGVPRSELRGRVAIVTGGSRGIGRAIAVAFARHGAAVAIVGRDESALKDVGTQIEAWGGCCRPIVADLAAVDEGGAYTLHEHVVGALGPVDVLVNNAAVGSSQHPREVIATDPSFWELTLHVNLTIPFLLTRAVLPGMVAAGYGRVINVSSTHGKVGAPTAAAYCASKHGLLGLTRATALEVAAAGVTVNAICPGATDTPLNDRLQRQKSERTGVAVDELIRRQYPMQRRVRTEEVAGLAVFLTSMAAASITGAAIDVDGGTLASS
jgi:3-hydroxybutyrate dehydrogenase